MNLSKQALLRRLHRPAGDDGSDTGGTETVDRGDDFTPTGDDDDLDPDNPDKGSDGKATEKSSLRSDKGAPKDGDKSDDDKDGEKDGEKDDDKEETKGRRKDTRIPLSRHQQLLERERAARQAAEQQLAKFQHGQKVASINEDLTKQEDKILAMEKSYNKLMADGETDKAAELMSQIRRAEREIVEAKAEMRTAAAVAQATETARYNIALERVEEAYPQLNPDSDEFDEELLGDVADLKAVYERRGDTPTSALQKAVKKLVKVEGRAQEDATEVKPRVTEKDIAAERRKQAVGKTTDAVRRQPPDTSVTGMDSDKAGRLTPKDILDMTQDDFAKLTDKELAKLRGDEL